MDKWAALEPVRLYDAPAPQTKPSTISTASRILGRARPKLPNQPYIGPLPVDLHIQIASYLPITAIPAYARASRATAAVCRHEKLWKKHWEDLGVEEWNLGEALQRLEEGGGRTDSGPATMEVVEQDVIDDDDDFGAFASAKAGAGMSPVNSFPLSEAFSSPALNQPTVVQATSDTSYHQKYIHAHHALRRILPALLAPPHLIIPTLFALCAGESSKQSSTDNKRKPRTLREQSQILHLLAFFLSPSLQPVLAWPSLSSALKSAVDRFEANALTAFDTADGRQNAEDMRDAAYASWEVYEGRRSQWEMGKVWAEKKEVFYEAGQWDSTKNVTYVLSVIDRCRC